MSTSILYHAWGIIGYDHVATRFVEGKMIFEIEKQTKRLRCSCCGSREVICRGSTPRLFRTLPVGGRPVFLELPVQRVECRACGAVRQAALDFADPRVSYTKRFERYALELLRFATILDVARHLSVSWDVIKGIQKQYLGKRFSKPKLTHLRRLAIDEIAVRKGHKYMTVVMDLDSGAVVFVGDSKGQEALEPFWNQIRKTKSLIEAVATDMGAAYIAAVRENLPNAAIVLDHFHVVKSFNDKLSELRRELYREATDKLHKTVLKGTRWLLLKNPENLDPEKNERAKLEEALHLNKPLATAYILKEELRTFWNQANKTHAEQAIRSWIAKAEATGIRILKVFAKTIAIHIHEILAYYDHRISTGPLEGMNNKIKTMKRQAYGFRDMEFFKLKIMALHETKYALVG